MITVMIVDDQEMIRTGLRTIIDSHPDLQVIAEAGDGYAALTSMEHNPADVVLMDIRMAGIDGVETTRRMRASHPDVRILVLTTFDEDANVLAAIRAGADGFYGKGAAPAELTDGIVRVARGDRALSSTAVNAVVGHIVDRTPPPPDNPAAARLFAALTPREREVVELIVHGLDNAVIAEQLFLSPFTVKTHANRAMMKVGARDRAQLVSLAVQGGMRP